MSLLEAKEIRKTYKTRFGGASVEALKGVSFTVEKGEYVAIMGESGSGKTTLLNIIAALDRPTEGTVVLDGMELSSVRDSDLARFRRDNLGYVFQDFNLLDTFSLEDNIYLPLVLAGMKAEEMKREIVSLRDRFTKQFELDGGFRQAVVYPQPVHFQDSGNWQDIDNSLQPMKLGDKTTGGVTHVARLKPHTT